MTPGTVPELTLERIEQSPYATYGHLTGPEHEALAVTLELPWRDNAEGRSCIPAGRFKMRRYKSPHHNGADVFVLVDVPERSYIELHVGNLPKDTLGCILVGTRYGMIGEAHGILESATAFARFMESMRGIDVAYLTVKDP